MSNQVKESQFSLKFAFSNPASSKSARRSLYRDRPVTLQPTTRPLRVSAFFGKRMITMMSGQCMWHFPISRIHSVPCLWHPHRWSYPLTGPPHSFQRLRSFFEIYCTWPTLSRAVLARSLLSRPLMTLAIYFRDKNVSCVTLFCWHVQKKNR